MISHCYPLLNLCMDSVDWKVKGRITLIPRRISPASQLRNSGAVGKNKMVWPISKPDVCRINKTAISRTWTFMLLMSLSHRSDSFSSLDEIPGNFNFKTRQSLCSHLLPMRLFSVYPVRISTLKRVLHKNFIVCKYSSFHTLFLFTAKTFWRTQ